MLLILGLAVVDPENQFRGVPVICGRRPPSSSNGLLGRFVIYITKIGWGGVHYWLLDFSRSTTFISSMKLKHLMVMKDVR